jgi:toxin ParE1/3/4
MGALWRANGFDSHLIFYRARESGIEIIRVLHGARDIGPILADE